MEHKVYGDREKAQARETDIVHFLERMEGFTFKKAGKYMKCVQHDSLMIYPDRKGWYWNSINIGGANALDYLQKIHSLGFPEAMERLVDAPELHEQLNRPMPAPKIASERAFSLPQPAEGRHSRVFAYLNKTRLVDVKIISALMHEKKIYQDNKGNAVFVGHNKDGEAKYASVRGTLSDVQYRGDVAGSDKSYGFALAGAEKGRVYVFESPIDLMSHATLANLATGDPEAWKQHNRVSLGGVSDVALKRYLDERPEVKNIVFCLDNDKAGLENTEKYIKKYSEMGYTVRNRPPRGKDFNEDLAQLSGVKSAEETLAKVMKNEPVAAVKIEAGRGLGL